MDKAEFVSRIANRLDVTPRVAEGVIDATLAELVAPAAFGTPGAARFLADNNCNNNCSREAALQAPTRPA
jgi:hypothetical protein